MVVNTTRLLSTAAALAVFAGALNAPAAAQIVSSTKPQNPNSGFLANPVPITDVNDAFDFSGQTLPALFSEIEFTMSLNDGDTGGPGFPVGYGTSDFDFNQLTLQFRGTEGVGGTLTNSAWLLNGFRDNQYDTRTFIFTTSAAEATQLTNIILGNNRVIAEFIDADPNDNFWDFRNNSGVLGTTTLRFGSAGSISAAPEPASLALFLPAVAVFGRRLRRRTC
jgi:hypothetical protein